jgi:hypothetical protein
MSAFGCRLFEGRKFGSWPFEGRQFGRWHFDGRKFGSRPNNVAPNPIACDAMISQWAWQIYPEVKTTRWRYQLGCQMVYFQTKNHNLGKFWRGSCNGRHWYILSQFGHFSGDLVYFRALMYILWSFGINSPFWYIVSRKIWQPWLPDRSGGRAFDRINQSDRIGRIFDIELFAYFWAILFENNFFRTHCSQKKWIH